MPADLIDADMVEFAVIEQLGKPFGIDAQAVRACLDSDENVAARISTGGPSPSTLRVHVNAAQARLDGWRARIERSRAQLQAATDEVAAR